MLGSASSTTWVIFKGARYHGEGLEQAEPPEMGGFLGQTNIFDPVEVGAAVGTDLNHHEHDTMSKLHRS